jgi:hypothetical protein
MATFCLSPIEWPATRLKVGPAASLPNRPVEANALSNSVDSETLCYTRSRAVRPLAPSYFQNTATLGALNAVAGISAHGTTPPINIIIRKE